MTIAGDEWLNGKKVDNLFVAGPFGYFRLISIATKVGLSAGPALVEMRVSSICRSVMNPLFRQDWAPAL